MMDQSLLPTRFRANLLQKLILAVEEQNGARRYKAGHNEGKNIVRCIVAQPLPVIKYDFHRLNLWR